MIEDAEMGPERRPAEQSPEAIQQEATAKEDQPTAGLMGIPAAKPTEERKQILTRAISRAAAKGRRVESQGDYQAVVVKNRLFGGEKRRLITVDEFGDVQEKKI